MTFPGTMNRRLKQGLTSSSKWSNLGQSNKKFQKKLIVTKIFTHKKFQNFFTFQVLIHEINLIALGSLK